VWASFENEDQRLRDSKTLIMKGEIRLRDRRKDWEVE
jgi:hypothetical protein